MASKLTKLDFLHSPLISTILRPDSLFKTNYLKGDPLEFKPYKHTANDVALDAKFDLTVPFKT